MLYDELNQKLKEAMRSKDTLLMNTIRNIKSKISEYLVANRIPRDNVSDEVVLNILATYKKALSKTIDIFRSAGDRANELISEYEFEIKFCESYLPKELSEYLEDIVLDAIEKCGALTMKQMGEVMKYIMSNNKGLDGNMVKKIVSTKLKEQNGTK